MAELKWDNASTNRDRMETLRAFDETKAGVKGLVDSSNLQKIPWIFVRPAEELDQESMDSHVIKTSAKAAEVPVIDLGGIGRDPERRKRVVEDVKLASETWGFFQVLNHGIPVDVLDGMIDGARRFNEQDPEEKKRYYSRDPTKTVRFNSSFDLFTARTPSWRDTLTISFSDPHNPTDPDDLPATCRESAMEYSKHVEILGNLLLGLLSEALGLETDRLKEMDCSKGHRLHCHYYPACPEPELAVGTAKHSDAGFLTILLQNNVSGLQVMHGGRWVDIEPLPGGLVVNIGDLLQLVSNGKLRSNKHRAISSGVGPRISIGCFFTGPVNGSNKIYGPIQELISEENPPIYAHITLSDYVVKFLATGVDNYRGLDHYKLVM